MLRAARTSRQDEAQDEVLIEPRSRRTVVDEHDVEALRVVRLEALDDEEDAAPVCCRGKVSCAPVGRPARGSSAPICEQGSAVSCALVRSNPEIKRDARCECRSRSCRRRLRAREGPAQRRRREEVEREDRGARRTADFVDWRRKEAPDALHLEDDKVLERLGRLVVRAVLGDVDVAHRAAVVVRALRVRLADLLRAVQRIVSVEEQVRVLNGEGESKERTVRRTICRMKPSAPFMPSSPFSKIFSTSPPMRHLMHEASCVRERLN